jgi:pimeloyl-ACP methyl ester carboxylesterase
VNRAIQRSTVVLFILAAALHADPPKLPADRHFFDSAGTKIHYLDKGEGEPVILIHGFGANLDVNWSGMSSSLAKEFRVIALDNRGHGRSDKPHDSAQYGIQMVGDIVRLMDHLQIKKAHVVGYSMGALITAKFLTEHPDRVISSVIGGMGWLQIDPKWEKFLSDVASSLDEGKGPLPLLRFLNSKNGVENVEEAIQGINTVLKITNDQKALAACARAFPQFQISKDQLAAIKTPTLVIVGDLDPFIDYVDAMKGTSPHMEIVAVQGGDHLTTIRSPIFLDRLKSFLDAHRQSPAPMKKDAPSKTAA